MLTKYVAALFVCFVFLVGNQLRGQDQLLKEYIYLDGRLLAVERQTVPAIAEQRVIEEDRDLKTDFAAYSPANTDRLFLPAGSYALYIPHPKGPSAGAWQSLANYWPIMMPDDLVASSAAYKQSISNTSDDQRIAASKAAGSVGKSNGGLDDRYVK